MLLLTVISTLFILRLFGKGIVLFKICISAQKLIICHRCYRWEDSPNQPVILLKIHRSLGRARQRLKRARSNGNNVTVIAYTESDLMYLLIKTVTFVCVIEARGQTQSLFPN